MIERADQQGDARRSQGSLDAAQVEAIYAYVKGRAEKKIPAGRPKKPGELDRS